VASIIELLSAIIMNHITLFSPSDLATIVPAVLDFYWHGIVASVAPTTEEAPSSIIGGRRGSPASTAFNSPAQTPSLNALGFETSLRKSLSTSRSRKESHTPSSPNTPHALRQSTSHASPRLGPQAFFASHTPKWPRALPALCAWLEMLINETTVDDETFTDILGVICFAFGQNDQDALPESAWAAPQQLIKLMLGPKGRRRGELSLRLILEGKIIGGKRAVNTVDVDKKMTRGAVM
jgi:hypothetical protein